MQFQVVFVDYGNHEKLPLHSLKPLNRGLFSTSKLAIRCKLANFKPNCDVNDEKSMKIINDAFLKLCTSADRYVAKTAHKIISFFILNKQNHINI